MTLTKADFAESLFDELGIDRREAKALVELFFEEIKDSLEQGKPVKISGFGNFELRDKTSRPGRNPKKRRGNTHNCQTRGDIPARTEA